MSFRQTFATRLRAQEELVGTFVKSRDPAVVEILGALGFDFFVWMQNTPPLTVPTLA